MLWWLPTVLIVGLMAVGAGGADLRLLDPAPGFYLFGLGIPIAAISALVLSGAAALASARGSAWRGKAVRAAAVPLLISVLLLAMMPLARSNPMHDVTTDPSVGLAPGIIELRPPEDYGEVIKQQAEVYPDLAPLDLPDLPSDEALQLALRVANQMPGWSVTSSDPESGRIYATAESSIFHFVDDVSILVEPRPPGGSLVQMRSRSRIGQSDLGANVKRIRAYLAAVQDAAN
jgi:uncharacterized protein (DUF1499 family)